MGDTWVSYGELREIVGDEAAGKLCEMYGGVSFYIPKYPSETNQLYDVIGFHALASLSHIHGGTTIVVPNRRKAKPSKSRILEMLEAGKTAREIALALDVTQRYVSQLAKDCFPKKRQGSLPGIKPPPNNFREK